MKRLDRIWTAIDRHPTVTDGVIAALLCALALLTLRINWHVVQPLPGRTAVGLTLLLMLPLTWRRRYPLAVLAAMTATYLLFRIVEVPETIWSINVWWLALFCAGAYGRAPWRDPVRAAAIAALASRFTYELFWRQLPQLAEDRTLYSLLNLAANSLLFGWLWWLGDMMRIRREREIQLAERTVELEIEREEKVRRAVLDERVRIARELHDVVAHHVSVMGVQAGAARRVLARRPEKAEEALATIEATSRQAVLELHRLLGILRQEPGGDGLAPRPTMHQIGALVTQMRDAGLPVDLTIEGDARPLPPSVDLSAYRIVQEALTNTLKHAGPARTSVTIRYGEQAVDVEVVDDGRGPSPDLGQQTGGNGLIGMRERVSLLGGELQVAHAPGVGFSVRAHLPLDGQPA